MLKIYVCIELRLNVKKELVLKTHIVSFLANDNQYEVNNN